MEDAEIVRLYLARDEAAIGHTKDKYGKRLSWLAYQMIEDVETAEECENDTYLRVWNAIPPHEPYDYFYPFLASIVRNVALNICRTQKFQKRKALVGELTAEMENTIPGQNHIEDFINDMALKALLNDFLEALSEEMRNVFLRRYWYMDSVERIARGYGMSVSKVKSILFRCRNKLKDCLEKEGYTL